MRVCYFCKARIDDKIQIYRNSECPNCGKDLKICYNCKYYSKGAHWDCLETIGEPVREKDRANFCEYFRFKEVSEPSRTGLGQATDKKKKAEERIRKLFGQ